MPFEVFDYRHDVRNIFVSPEIRGRFMRLEPGQVATRHSHDLGHEMFLVLEGQCEFEIDGERAVLGPGQACVAQRDQMHQVRTVGDQPMTMYLSVTPHVEPTHTMWTADPLEGGRKERPRYGTWKNRAQDQIADQTESPTELADQYLTAVRALSDISAPSLSSQQRHVEALKRALANRDAESARQAVDVLWRDLFPLLRAVSNLEETWNALAPEASKP